MREPIVRLILLGHKAGVGKDTLAQEINTRLESSHVIPFAGALKRNVMWLYRLDRVQVYGDQKNEVDARYGLTPRQILQAFGQEQRARHSAIWIDHLLYAAHETWIMGLGFRHPPEPPTTDLTIIVPDFRFPNEFEALQERHAALELPFVMMYQAFRIDRERDESFAGAKDISETALDGWDKWTDILVNDGTPEDLYNKIKPWIELPESNA